MPVVEGLNMQANRLGHATQMQAEIANAIEYLDTQMFNPANMTTERYKSAAGGR